MPAVRNLDTATGPVSVLVDERPAGPGAPVLWPSIGEYPCYDAFLYQALTEDAARNERFRAALAAVAPGRVVLDIGTGQDMLWARESVRLGARHVVAMEVMESSFRQAAQALRADGLADRITLLLGSSTELEIGARADVCVAEVIGSLAGAEGAAVIFADARRRHLVPGGTVIPHRAVTQAAAVSLDEVMGGRPAAFAESALPYLRTIFDWNGAPFDVRMRIASPVAGAAVSAPAPVELLDFNGDLRPDGRTRARLPLIRPGRIDGILTWLELWCDPGRPPLTALGGETSWASVYFPLFHPPVGVRPGDVLDVEFAAMTSDDGVHPDYRLTATITSGGAVRAAGAHDSPHHGRAFRGSPAYRRLFPEPSRLRAGRP